MSNSSTLPILMQENINDILASTPEAYSVNTRSVERCNTFGNDLRTGMWLFLHLYQWMTRR